MMDQRLKTSRASGHACGVSLEFSRRLPSAQAMTSTPHTDDKEGGEPITSVPFTGRANLSQQYTTQPGSPRIYERWDLCEGYWENGSQIAVIGLDQEMIPFLGLV